MDNIQILEKLLNYLIENSNNYYTPLVQNINNIFVCNYLLYYNGSTYIGGELTVIGFDIDLTKRKIFLRTRRYGEDGTITIEKLLDDEIELLIFKIKTNIQEKFIYQLEKEDKFRRAKLNKNRSQCKLDYIINS